ncbi:MAG: polyprenyl synthetase family protein [Armatimonadetes bacterium]|nr:polyprenyl synthetase family protein [Armatimonadota bacterium]
MKSAAFFEAVQNFVPGDTLAEVSAIVADVEKALVAQVGSDVASVQGSAEQTLLGGGKRLRPALAAMSARAVGRSYDRASVVQLGAALEMIHMATLIHDDVIDGADTRRGHPTSGAVYGNTAAILSGDVLLAKAMMLLAESGDVGIIQMVSRAVVEMAEGEVRELECRGDFELSEQEHMRIMRMKTAAFIECCCRAGCMLAGGTSRQEEALGAYGRHLGLAFQIVDDLLDFQGDGAKTGKGLATDFREGQATLPLIYLVPRLSEDEAAFARQRFGDGATDEEMRKLSEWMSRTGAYDAAADRASSFAASAIEGLSALADTDDRRLLETVAKFVVEREA